MTDTIWKIAVFIIGTVLVPTFGWVWTTHTQLNNLRTEYQHTQESVRKMEENTVEIKLIQRDISHMNEKMDELMVLVVKMSQE